MVHPTYTPNQWNGFVKAFTASYKGGGIQFIAMMYHTFRDQLLRHVRDPVEARTSERTNDVFREGQMRPTAPCYHCGAEVPEHRGRNCLLSQKNVSGILYKDEPVEANDSDATTEDKLIEGAGACLQGVGAAAVAGLGALAAVKMGRGTC